MESETKKCACKRGKLIAVILAVLVVGVICCHLHHSHHKKAKPGAKVETLFDLELGTDCIIQFRRDALGGSTSPISPKTTSLNGTDVCVNGKLIAVNSEAIHLEYDNNQFIINGVPQLKRLWIPKSSILFIEYEKLRTE